MRSRATGERHGEVSSAVCVPVQKVVPAKKDIQDCDIALQAGLRRLEKMNGSHF